MAKANNQALHWVLGAALLLIVVFVVGALLLSNTMAATSQVEISNAAPTFVAAPVVSNTSQGVEAYSGSPGTIGNLTAGGDRTIYIYGEVEDNNGQDDFNAISISLYKTGITCAANPNNDPNNCYWNNDSNAGVGTCTFTNDANPLRKDYECSANLASWTDATDADAGSDAAKQWYLKVTVGDGTTMATNTARTFEVSSLASLSIPATVDFGTMALNSVTTSANNQSQTITQQGNVANDVKVSMAGANMNCSASTAGIPRANLKWSVTDVSFDSGTAMTDTPVDTDLGVAKQISASAVTKPLYWNISIPYGVEGTCSSTVTMTAYNGNL
jgi:hypothetical protein